jgi:hypothetical protein
LEILKIIHKILNFLSSLNGLWILIFRACDFSIFIYSVWKDIILFLLLSINKQFGDLVLLTSPHDDVDSSNLESYLLLKIYITFQILYLLTLYISAMKSSSSSATIYSLPAVEREAIHHL